MRHGQSKRAGSPPTRLYRTWSAMLTRCHNPNVKHYQGYGGRGIAVCDRWHRFENFAADMGEPPAGLTLDRIDNDGNYEPGNCRWATNKEQSNNTRTVRLITHNGETKCIRDWERALGLGYGTIYKRLREGWSTADALVSTTYEGNRFQKRIAGK